MNLTGLLVVCGLIAASALLAMYFARDRGARTATARPGLANTPLVFKSSEAMFRTMCKFGQNEITTKRPLLGLVVDAAAEFGVQNAVKRNDDGTQTAVIDVVSNDGGFRTIAVTATGGREPLAAGDLVAWLPLRKLPEPIANDPRTRWVGLIVAKCAAECDASGDPKVLAYY